MATRPGSVVLGSSVLLLLVHLFSTASFASTDGSVVSGSSGRRDLLGYRPLSRKAVGGGGEAIPNCREMGSRSECGSSSRWCRWCRSDALDDGCFGSSEAWRLPHQVSKEMEAKSDQK